MSGDSQNEVNHEAYLKKKEHAKKYPECAKLSLVGDERRALMQFLEWLNEEGIRLAEYVQDELAEVTKSKDNLLYAYLDIDPVKLEEERRAMIEELNP